MTPLTWVVISALVAVNALYVAAEFAAVGARRTRIQQLAQQGHPLARRLLPVLEDTRLLDRYIAACQIGITLSSLVLGAYGQATLAVWLAAVLDGREAAAPSLAAGIVLAGLTTFQVLLGELVPKSLALQYPTQAALYTVLPMRWSLVLFSWFIAVLNGSGLLLLRLLGVPAGRHRHLHSPDEIALLFAESRDGGLLEPDEHRRLTDALELAARPIHQLMVPRGRIVALSVSMPMEQVLRALLDGPYTRLPVYRDTIDTIVGQVHARDVVRAWAEQGPLLSLEPVLRPVVFVPNSVTADRVLTQLRQTHHHLAIVIDEYGGVKGLVTLADILGEVFGPLGDEFKQEVPEAEPLADGRVRLAGAMRVDEAVPWVGELREGTADTIGGRVVEVLGYVPEGGERVRMNGSEVEVERVEANAVVSVVVTPPPAEEASPDG